MRSPPPESTTRWLDRALDKRRVHEPPSSVVEETLAWIDGDLQAMGGWVPPVSSQPLRTEESSTFAGVLDGLRWRAKLGPPLLATACLSFFIVSTAVAFNEASLGTRDGGLAIGEIDELSPVLAGGANRFATYVAPSPPSVKAVALLAELQRSIDASPAGSRTIGSSDRRPSAPRSVSRAWRQLVAQASVSDALPATVANADRIGNRIALPDLELAVDRSKVEETPLLLDDGLAKPVIRAVVDSHRQKLRACYEVELRRASGLRTRMTLHWTVAIDGTVSQASVSEATPSWPALESCLVAEVRSWSFPRPGGLAAVDVSYPIVFRPQSSD